LVACCVEPGTGSSLDAFGQADARSVLAEVTILVSAGITLALLASLLATVRLALQPLGGDLLG
jgi:hypothetical protein